MSDPTVSALIEQHREKAAAFRDLDNYLRSEDLHGATIHAPATLQGERDQLRESSERVIEARDAEIVGLKDAVEALSLGMLHAEEGA